MEIQYNMDVLTAYDYQQLRVQSNMLPVDENALKLAIQNSWITITAVCNKKVVGMLRIIGDRVLFCYIQDVLVAPQYRNRGIGKKLIEHALHTIQSSIPCGANMVVSLFAEPGREQFYEKLGFLKAPGIAVGHGMHCMVCGKKEAQRKTYYFKMKKK